MISTSVRAGLSPPIPGDREALLADRLERLCRTFDVRHLDPDPLLLVREYTDPKDRVVAGIFAAALAFGGVRQIMASLRDLFTRMDNAPYSFVTGFRHSRHASRFDGWYHRFIRAEDIVAFIWSIQREMRTHGSLGGSFAAGFSLEDGDIAHALSRFVKRLRDVAGAPVRPGRFFDHLLSSPSDGSACKRMNLFLRWMVRSESPDLGLWPEIPTSHLILPLDTHTARISRNIGLTRRSTVNWKMAREVTSRLAQIDASDPVKFDYALCRLGILDHCPRARDREKCGTCIIRDICIL